MQNRTDLVGIPLPEQIRQICLRNNRWFQTAGILLTGYLLSGSRLFGGIAPFGAALCASMPGMFGLAAALGAIAGYSFMPGGGMKYIAAIVLLLGLKWLFGVKASQGRRTALNSLCCFLSLGTASIAMTVFSSGTLYDALLAVAELFFACGATYFLTRALQCVKAGPASLSKAGLSCLTVTFAILITGFSSVTVAGLSLGRIAAVFAVLLCARYAGESGGAIGGITAGMALGLSGGDFSYAIIAYGFGGLVAGIFGGMGRVATAASFIVLHAVTALLTKDYAHVYIAIFEIFIASVAFVAVPPAWIMKFRLIGQGGQAVSPSAVSAQHILRDRLNGISAALLDIGSTTQKVGERLGRMENLGVSGISNQVAETVCSRCNRRSECWQTRYSDTVAAINDCIGVLRKKGSLPRERMPAHFAGSCEYADEFAAALSERFRDHVAREGVLLKVSKIRSVVTDQFDGMSMMLGEISRDLCAIKVQDSQKTCRVKEYFQGEGITVQQTLCYTDEHNRLTVEATIPAFQIPKLSRTKSALDLCALLEADMDLPQITPRETHATVVYTEKAVFSIDFGAYQIPMGQNRLCGDAYDYIRNRGGRAHFVLSDGMGSGGSAAVDSSMASGLMTRLLSVGIGHEASLKMVNSALLIKSGEESLATIDICSLDLYSGKAEFYKAGAAPTFLFKNGRAGYVESTSLPAGILRGVTFERSSIALRNGDIVVMVSDGAIATGADWIGPELEAMQGADIQRLCEKLALSAKMRRTDGREDDITVMAIALRYAV